MASNRTPTRFYGPASVGTGAGSLYEVPAGKIAVVKFLDYVVGGSSDDLTLGVGSTSAVDRFFKKTSIGANDTYFQWIYLPLVEAEEIFGVTDTGSDNLQLTISGDLYDV